MLKFRDQQFIFFSNAVVLPIPIINEVALSRVIVIMALAVGSFLRIWQINAMGYNTDEAVCRTGSNDRRRTCVEGYFPRISSPSTFIPVHALSGLQDTLQRSIWTVVGCGSEPWYRVHYLSTWKDSLWSHSRCAGCLISRSDALSRDCFAASAAGRSHGILCHPHFIFVGSLWKFA